MTHAKVGKLYKGDTFTELQSFPEAELKEQYGAPQLYTHRIDLAESLTLLATQAAGDGPPVRVVYNADVEGYEPGAGIVHLSDGTEYAADLIVAADGVHSRAPATILGRECPAEATGTTIIRFMLPTASLRSNPLTSRLVETDGQFSIYIGPDRQRWLLQYPCRDETLQNFGMYSLQDDEHDADVQSLRFKCDKKSLERELEGFNESVVGVAGLAAEILPVWKIQERQPLETWYNGRLLVIGLVRRAFACTSFYSTQSALSRPRTN